MYTAADLQIIARELARTGGNRARAAQNLRRERARFSTLSYKTITSIAKRVSFAPILQEQSQYVRDADHSAALEVETLRSRQLQAGQDEPKVLARQLLSTVLLSSQDLRQKPEDLEENERLVHATLPLLKFLSGR
jgi:hypothetical protein